MSRTGLAPLRPRHRLSIGMESKFEATIHSCAISAMSGHVRLRSGRYRVTLLHDRRGNLEGALEYLKRAKDQRFADLSRVYKDQEFASLWMDPRLERIIKR